MRSSLSFLLLAVILSGCSAEGSAIGGGGPGRGPGPGTDAGMSMMPPSSEVCGDGMDNDFNGLADEGCTCAIGTSQPCWTGAPERRGVGACRDGVQSCEMFGEFAAWGACVGDAQPSGEVGGTGARRGCDGS